MTDIPGRQRLSRIQRQEVEKIILNAKLSNLSIGQTQQIIQERLNILLSESWITHIRMKFKADCKKQLKKLSLDRYEFISHYMERIAEVKNLQTKFWEAYNKVNDPFQRIQCMKEAREQTVLLLDLLEHLPIIATVNTNDFAETYGSQNVSEENPAEDQSSNNETSRVF